MIKCAITGELGSGKSFISKIFENKGIPVYNCDNRSKWLLLNNQELIFKIKNEFGENIYEGESVFKNLSKITFSENDNDKLKILMNLITPYFLNDLDLFFNANLNYKFCLVESAILFETKFHLNFDEIIYVYVPEDIRIERAKLRDGMTENEYKIRMKNQIHYIDKIKFSKFIIHNYNLSQEEFNFQIEHIFNYLSK